jgi:polyhydroxyalkanoate synthesis regulator phasin
MNSDNLIQLLQQGFRVSLGATTSLIESLQDSQKREETLSKLMRSEFSQLTEEWAEKGEITEREARNYVDALLHQQTSQTTAETSGTTYTSPTTPPTTTVAAPDVQLEIQELTAQIAAMRAELEQMRNQDSQS